MGTMLILRATAGDMCGQEFAYASPSHLILGRSRSCTMRLPGDATVSRQHCLIEVDEDGAWIQDLGSLNGTLINGMKIGQRERSSADDATMLQPARQVLQTGDELRICNNAFVVELMEIYEPVPMAGARRSAPSTQQSSDYAMAGSI